MECHTTYCLHVPYSIDTTTLQGWGKHYQILCDTARQLLFEAELGNNHVSSTADTYAALCSHGIGLRIKVLR